MHRQVRPCRQEARPGFQVVHMMDCRNPERDRRRRNRVLARAEVHPAAAVADGSRDRAIDDETRHEILGEHHMKRFSLALAASLLARAATAARPQPNRGAGDRLRFRRQRADAARRHLSRRGRRRRDQLEGRHLRLHPHRRSDADARRRARASPMAARACSSSIATESSSARSARTSTASCSPQQVRVDPQDNIWVVDQMSTW